MRYKQSLLLAALGSLISASGITFAADNKPVLPSQMIGTQHVIVGVAWDEAVVRKALPEGMTPVAGAPGAINIYTAPKGSGIAPYSSVYFWVDVEGYDAPDGTKGRWMLTGAYGPNEGTSRLLREVNHLPVRNGTSRAELTADGKRAIGTVNGNDVVVAEIKSSSEPCASAGGVLNYPVMNPSKQVLVVTIPYFGDFCKAEPVSVKVTAPEGDPFAAFKPVKVLWAAEFKNGNFAIPVATAAK